MSQPMQHLGVGLALSAAALLSTGCASYASYSKTAANNAENQRILCEGVNSCRGQSVCATAKHNCAGLNNCKGQGVVSIDAKECLTEGGIIQNAENV